MQYNAENAMRKRDVATRFTAAVWQLGKRFFHITTSSSRRSNYRKSEQKQSDVDTTPIKCGRTSEGLRQESRGKLFGLNYIGKVRKVAETHTRTHCYM